MAAPENRLQATQIRLQQATLAQLIKTTAALEKVGDSNAAIVNAVENLARPRPRLNPPPPPSPEFGTIASSAASADLVCDVGQP